MEEPEQNEVDHSPAVPLEITAELAAQVDEQLRDFAEDAELETALVVDQSGAVVSGISSEEEVTIEVISALVAGASGAMRALVSELGETGGIESFHQGENRVVYLSEIVHRFVLDARHSIRPPSLPRKVEFLRQPAIPPLAVP